MKSIRYIVEAFIMMIFYSLLVCIYQKVYNKPNSDILDVISMVAITLRMLLKICGK